MAETCRHAFGHPSLPDEECLPCTYHDETAEFEHYDNDMSYGWDSDHPWDRVIPAPSPVDEELLRSTTDADRSVATLG